MPVGILSNANATAECAAVGAGNPDTSQVGGDYQNGSFSIPVTGPYGSGFNVARVQQLPALTRVILSGSGNPTVTKIGPQEYSATLSLSGTDTVQLSPAYANSQNVPTAQVAPAVPAFTYTSRNSYVATVSPTGMVTGLHIGECTVLVSAFRGINATFAGATPPAGLTGCEIALELAVKVRD
jgi:Bacterial Ig-like domain (group 2)